jgi:OOP family OmpA-OmpF porin
MQTMKKVKKEERMNRKRMTTIVAILALLAPALALAQTAPKTFKVPKVDAFVYFVDQSGSMYETHEQAGKKKMALGKEALLAVNDDVPELGYRAACDLFAPSVLVVAPSSFDAKAFHNCVAQVPEEQDIFGRQTPMGPGIDDLDSVLRDMSGDKAIIMVTDGHPTVGENPLQVVRRTYRNFPNTCFHIISVADDAKGHRTLEQIAAIKDCTVTIDAQTAIGDSAAREEYVRRIFYGMAEEASPPPPEPEEIRLRDIHFEFDKSYIKTKWEPILQNQIEVMKSLPTWDIVIEGHTDSIGTVQYNQGLSERRARSTYDFFVRQGIDPDRMKTAGYSENRPIATNETERGRRLNRRAVIVLQKP